MFQLFAPFATVSEVAVRRIGEFTRRVTDRNIMYDGYCERAFLQAEPLQGEYVRTLSEDDVHDLLSPPVV